MESAGERPRGFLDGCSAAVHALLLAGRCWLNTSAAVCSATQRVNKEKVPAAAAQRHRQGVARYRSVVLQCTHSARQVLSSSHCSRANNPIAERWFMVAYEPSHVGTNQPTGVQGRDEFITFDFWAHRVCAVVSHHTI